MNLSQITKRYERAEKELVTAVVDAYVGAIHEVLESCRLPEPVEVVEPPVRRARKGRADKPRKAQGVKKAPMARLDRDDNGMFVVTVADGRTFQSKYRRNIDRILKREGLTLR